MESPEIFRYYHPNLSDNQIDQLMQYAQLIVEWNAKINLISRKDEDHVITNHILHALSIYKVIQFAPGTKVLDVGTGGGFPGIPLAIANPESEFLLVDAIGKKIHAVTDMAERLGLTNVKAEQQRAEKVPGKFDFVTARAVTQTPKFVTWVRMKVSHFSKNTLQNGLLLLKGGDLTDELRGVNYDIKTYQLSDIYAEPFYQTKKLLHITGF